MYKDVRETAHRSRDGENGDDAGSRKAAPGVGWAQCHSAEKPRKVPSRIERERETRHEDIESGDNRYEANRWKAPLAIPGYTDKHDCQQCEWRKCVQHAISEYQVTVERGELGQNRKRPVRQFAADN
jgi:hypothetical protein